MGYSLVWSVRGGQTCAPVDVMHVNGWLNMTKVPWEGKTRVIGN